MDGLKILWDIEEVFGGIFMKIYCFIKQKFSRHFKAFDFNFSELFLKVSKLYLI